MKCSCEILEEQPGIAGTLGKCIRCEKEIKILNNYEKYEEHMCCRACHVLYIRKKGDGE